MKIKLFAVIVVLTTQALQAQNELTIIIKAIRSEQGSIMVGLFRSEQTFLKKPAYAVVIPVDATTVEVGFSNIGPGAYAVSIIHDENNNDKLDKNALGIPKEGFAFGNNAMGLFGPPAFDKCKVIVSKGSVRHEVQMRYF